MKRQDATDFTTAETELLRRAALGRLDRIDTDIKSIVESEKMRGRWYCYR